MKRKHRARFRALTVLQAVLLVMTTIALAWTAVRTTYIAVPLLIGFVILVQVYVLLRFIENHVDTLEEFFAAINYEDFTRRFVEDDLDVELKAAFNRILQQFQEARAQRDVQAGYLETVVRHVPVPFIAVRQDGTLSLINKPARRLTGMASLHHLEQLAELDPALPEQLRSIASGQQKMLQTKIRGVPVELRISAAEIRLANGVERLYSIENLSGELTARESSAWRNLIRVLTHEIMNTLTPVSSLAQTTKTMLNDPQAADDVRDAIETIARRSEGLMNFVSRYRELLTVPNPEPVRLLVGDVLKGIVKLLQQDLQGVQVELDVEPASLEVHADRSLLDQVLLNLVKNALESMLEQQERKLTLRAYLDFGRTIIKVADSGAGIGEDAVEHIFVPFFTTKRDGSGIGLSLSRQIMSAHGGEIVVDSDRSGATVSLIF